MPPVGFEPTISAGERPQTYALDRATKSIYWYKKLLILQHSAEFIPSPTQKWKKYTKITTTLYPCCVESLKFYGLCKHVLYVNITL